MLQISKFKVLVVVLIDYNAVFQQALDAQVCWKTSIFIAKASSRMPCPMDGTDAALGKASTTQPEAVKYNGITGGIPSRLSTYSEISSVYFPLATWLNRKEIILYMASFNLTVFIICSIFVLTIYTEFYILYSHTNPCPQEMAEKCS